MPLTHGDASFGLVDTLVVLVVIKNATWSIFHSNFGERDGHALTVGWYALAALYVAAAWLAAEAQSPGIRLVRFIRAGFATATVTAAALATYALWPPATQPSPISWYDWLVLPGCFLLCAAFRRPPSAAALPNPNDLKDQ